MNPKYSFIVPFYNVENYVETCITSLLKQTYESFEIIIVDDGSTDGSYERCVQFLSSSEKVCIIRQENMGLGEARNTGLQRARGEYIIFVDSDDFWNKADGLEKIDSKINQCECDVLCFDFLLLDNNTGKIRDRNIRLSDNVNNLNAEKRIKKLLIHNGLKFSAWSKVLNRKFLLTNNLFFNKGLSEDMDWTARILMLTQKIYYLDEKIYVYRAKRSGSITNTVKRDFLKGWCDILDKIFSYDKEIINQVNEKSENKYYYFSKIYGIILINYLRSKRKDEYVRGKILEYKFLISYLTGLKMFVFKVANFFGLELFMKIMRK